jgi:hypothetical protein
MEYRSKTELLGLPLVHICVAEPSGKGFGRKHALGWIAMGDTAVGALVAVGGGAMGTLAIGGASVGVLSIGGASLGVLALGGCAIGYWALGGAALALHAALGGLAVAGDYAIGGSVHALHANDETAKAFFARNAFFEAGQTLMRFSPLALLFLAIPLLANRKRSEDTHKQEPFSPR